MLSPESIKALINSPRDSDASVAVCCSAPFASSNCFWASVAAFSVSLNLVAGAVVDLSYGRQFIASCSGRDPKVFLWNPAGVSRRA